jgi:hypothetical protein
MALFYHISLQAQEERIASEQLTNYCGVMPKLFGGEEKRRFLSRSDVRDLSSAFSL